MHSIQVCLYVSLLQVAKPLDVKTKFMNIEVCALCVWSHESHLTLTWPFLTQDDILLEVQIQNTTPMPMFLETVTFDPSSGFTSLDLSTTENKKWDDIKFAYSKITVQVHKA